MAKYLTLLTMLVFSTPILGQTKSGSRDFIFTLPIVSITEDAIGHFEMNLNGVAGLAIEGSIVQETQRISEEKMEETGESMITKGKSVTILVSRYSQPAILGGFYWGLGVGYRQLNMDWKVQPDENDEDIDFTLVDETNRLTHRGSVSGVTGVGRLGYRYVGTEYPFMVGVYMGIRHFEGGVSDNLDATDEDKEEGITVAAMSDAEKDSLHRRFKTALMPGLELGFAF